ncbi:hypothetical protein G7Y89_g1528 [Cudoniella acicularis]|uniref:PD-(D/E)XK nuclease-like domain-containing protein n=1 Tax=Cudoniella acicularis TaxID=354080 RepID=A0A8H4W7U4_9HELO|nr:hypothetical protein G7Y89_g1528 [Cudoniella acicularis]
MDAILDWLQTCNSEAHIAQPPLFPATPNAFIDDPQFDCDSSGIYYRNRKAGARSLPVRYRCKMSYPAKSALTDELEPRRSRRTNTKSTSKKETLNYSEARKPSTEPFSIVPQLAQQPHLDPPSAESIGGLSSTVNLEIDTRSETATVVSTQSTSVSRSRASFAKGGRSRSPVKKVVDLSAARPTIRYHPGTASPEVVGILKRFQRVVKRKHVLPRCLKDQIRTLEPDQMYETDDEFDYNPLPSTNQESQTLRKLTKIRNNSWECSRLAKPEPSWGGEVYKLLLDYAVKLENKTAEQMVQVEDITTIPVAAQFLPLGMYDVPLQAKQVDYGIFLSQSDKQRNSLRSSLEARMMAPEDLCVNQTPVYAEYIRWLPQLLPIETKTNESNGVSAEAQLGIWMAGFKNRLENLLAPRKEGNPPRVFIPMPCVKIQGFEWKMYWCCALEEGEMIIYGPFELGTTQTLLGTYCILTGLRELIRGFWLCVATHKCIVDFGESYDISAPPQRLGIAPAYSSPEILFSELAGVPTDMWALACSLAEIRSGNKLFYDMFGDKDDIISSQLRSILTNIILLFFLIPNPPLLFAFAAKALAAALEDIDDECGTLTQWPKVRMNVNELASLANADPKLLVRIMRALTLYGVFTEVEEETYEHSRFSSKLSQPSTQLSALPLAASSVNSVSKLLEYFSKHSFRNPGDDPSAQSLFQYTNNTNLEFFEWMQTQPYALNTFNEKRSKIIPAERARTGKVLADFYPFGSLGESLSSPDEVVLVDVGGGYGHALYDI